MNAIVKAAPSVTVAANPLMPTSLDSALRLADMMATAKLVPVHLQGKPGDCLLVIEQAMRWQMSPFAVAQATSVIQGRLMFEGKLVSAALNASGILVSRMTYEFDGEAAGRAVTASATIRGETKPRAIRVTLAEAKTSNQLWTKQPDQQLVYFSTRAWARRHAPEVMLGVYSPEEFDAPPADTFRGTTVEAERPIEVTVTTRREEINRVVPMPAPRPEPKQTVGEFLAELEGMLSAADTADAVDAIAALPRVQRALGNFKPEPLAQLNKLVADALERCMPGGAAEDYSPTSTDDVPFPGDVPLTA